jgi:phosphocarrier protein
MQLVELANTFGSKIELAKGTLNVDAKSIMSVMRLAATQGTVLKLTADGADAEEAAQALTELIASGFGEMGDEPDS